LIKNNIRFSHQECLTHTELLYEQELIVLKPLASKSLQQARAFSKQEPSANESLSLLKALQITSIPPTF
jgi:hypothetical protein